MSGWDHEENSPAPPPKHRTLDECLIEEQQKDLAAKDAKIERLNGEMDCLAAWSRKAEAERDALQKAYDLVQSGHGWCRCHDAVEVQVAENARLKATAATLRAALTEIVEEGGRYDTMTLRGIARRALEGEKS